MDVDAFDMAKAGMDDQLLDWARGMRIVSYGVVREVLDGVNVRCAFTVQQSPLAEQTVDVTLLSLSSQLFSCNVMPLVGDQVLIFGLDAWSDKVITGGTEVVHGGRQGYNNQSCVGVLMRTLRMGGAFAMSLEGNAEAPVIALTLNGSTEAMFGGTVSLAVLSGDGAEHPVNVDVLKNRPITMRVDSAVEATHGADIKVTIGKNTGGDDVSASVTLDLGEQSDIKLTSKSGAEVSFDKDFSLTVKGAVKMSVKGDVEIAAKGNATVKADGDVQVEAGGQCTVKSASGLTLASGDASAWQPNIVPTCPFGMPHGGPSGGVVMLKGQ